MTSTSEADGSEDVNDFLQRIRELGEKRDKEDEERTRKLEEEILQGRKERQARRAERARSISPTKDSSPLLDPARLSMSSLSHRAIDPPEQLEPTPRTPVHDTHSGSNSFRDEIATSVESSPAGSRLGGGSDKGASPKASPRASPTLRSRAGTLSWQQRPTSRDLSGNRTFFSTSPSRETRWRAMSNASTDEPGVLRSPLASIPVSRESSSLRQTEGSGTPTLEKQGEERKEDPFMEAKAKEPEVEKATELEKENILIVDERSPPPSRASSTLPDSSLGYRYSSVSSVSTATGLGSPIPLAGAPKFEPPRADDGVEGHTVPPTSPRRLSPERSTSPTKGLGGFVQSAMLRRSDSISKRWSAQLPSGRSRGESFTSNRNSFAAPSNTDIFSTPKSSHEGSSLSPVRPTSSHSEATIVSQTKEGERPATPPVPRRTENISRPPLSLHARSTSSVGVDSPVDSNSRPTTPSTSRTMDPRRWSPTKSSWLESALNLPDSPRHKRQPSQQTSWAKERQSRGSVDLGRRNSFKEVTPVGLMRTTPLGSHVTKPSLSGIPDVLNPSESSPTREEHPVLSSPTKERSFTPSSPTKEETLGASPTKEETPIIPSPTKEESLASSPIKEEPRALFSLKTEESRDLPRPTKEEPLGSPGPAQEEQMDIASPTKEEPQSVPSPTEEPPTLTSPAREKSLETPSTETSPPPEPKVIETPAEAPKFSTTKAVTRKPAPPSLSPAPRLNDGPLQSPREPIRDPLLTRPKPQSPVIDFRANLRKREVAKDQSTSAEPEFKNVFGKLKKTETSNYVAPDELKNNILRGKAALNTTGGPQKTQRVDEFRESILKQKEAMKLNGGSVRRSTVGQSDAPTKAVPEAILKRQHLAKPSSDKNELPADGVPSAAADKNKSPVRLHNRQLSLDPSSDHERAAPPQPEPTVTDERIEDIDSPKEDLYQRATVAETNDEFEPKEDEALKVQEEPVVEAIKPVRAFPPRDTARAPSTLPVKDGPVTKGSLAGRINPALAGLLSRGPSVAAGGPVKGLPAPKYGESSASAESSTSAPTLTHMTKARARGPKRRPPKTIASTDAIPDETSSSTSPDTPPLSSDVESAATAFSPTEPSFDTSGGWPLPDQGVQSNVLSETELVQPPSPATSIPKTVRDSLPPVPEKDPSPSPNPAPSTPSKRPQILERRVYEADSQDRSPSIRSAFTPSQPATSPSSPHGSQTRSSLAQYSSPSPSPLRTSFRENQSYPSPRMTGHHAFLARSRDSSPFRKSLPSPPVPPKGPSIATDEPSSPRSSVSLVPQADESLEAISHFFRTFPRSSDRVNIDPQLMLMEKNDGSRIRTLRKQVWEITGEGKKQDLPTNKEYILFEGSMYLCVHVFEEDGNARSEVHLWCGDDVWGGAVDNALAFARKVARENGCKLEVVSQGKEPARFIQALGGILITRRGSSSRSSSSAIFMLCGRKHLGQMVFDEVDFAPRNLCTGYPFVLSAMFGKVYLWKGKGSSAEEIGAARLIGMDLGLTGEFEEVAEGEEPSSFYEVFPHQKETEDYIRSNHWLLKPAHEHFGHRLLRVDHELGQRSFWIRRPGSSSPVIRPNDTVQEIEPFSQKDLSPKGIYILDTFFEIYVIVGEQASNRPAEFASAVVFAHEYGILAASLQDRPFIPKSYISLGGAPESCRSAFRKWSRRPLQRPPQVYPLNAAIDAIRS
ncbi:hypothetical protein ASPCAL09057 [Aspergillus calidoustus]|uniref:DUF4045 domain-containing protein n=1 Tax=Aspergillus calidoustus TaxID=454130 RepID=A0A0U5GS18_ASPCI|nr:hypothetical protein ASPCAL09057 [Aspergillus calidoustus]